MGLWLGKVFAYRHRDIGTANLTKSVVTAAVPSGAAVAECNTTATKLFPMELAGARLCDNARQYSVSGPVTVERAAWRDVAPEGFGWDAYRQQCVRVNAKHKTIRREPRLTGARLAALPELCVSVELA